jgi:hypothetical protein
MRGPRPAHLPLARDGRIKSGHDDFVVAPDVAGKVNLHPPFAGMTIEGRYGSAKLPLNRPLHASWRLRQRFQRLPIFTAQL